MFYDEGISGTSTNREGFQNLMKECENNNIDIILVKSISRFTRNTLDFLSTIRHLKDLGIDVRKGEHKLAKQDLKRFLYNYQEV